MKLEQLEGGCGNLNVLLLHQHAPGYENTFLDSHLAACMAVYHIVMTSGSEGAS